VGVVRRWWLVGYGFLVDGYGLSRHSSSLVAVAFESFSSQSEMDHCSHCIHFWTPVDVIRKRFASEQTRKIVSACLCAYNLPLFTLLSTTKDKMFSRLDCFATLVHIHFYCFDVVQVPV
jgi:hypothetical protein